MIYVKTSHSLQQVGDNIRSKLETFQKELRHVWRDIFKKRRPGFESLLRNNLSIPVGGNQAKLPEYAGRHCHKISGESCLAKGHDLL
jgi:hypothetical protein